MKKINVLISLFLLFLGHSLTLLAFDEVRFENITNTEGLSHNTVRHIMQDSHGFMWFSTVNGLNRYDGHKFIVFQPNFEENSLSESNIRKIVKDKNEHIWVQTTSRSMHCYDAITETFVNYTSQQGFSNFNRVEVLPSGDVWLWGYKNGACRVLYDGENNPISQAFDVNTIGTNSVAFVLSDSNGQVWIGTNKGLIQLIDGAPIFCNTDNINYSYCNVVEVKDKIFFLTENERIIVYDKKQKIFLPAIEGEVWEDLKVNIPAKINDDFILITSKQYPLVLDTKTHKLTDANVFWGGEHIKNAKLLKDNKKNIWLYNNSGNLWKYNHDSRSVKKYNLMPENVLNLIDAERFNVYQDSRNITWITTYGNGLFAIEASGKINHFTTNNSRLKTNFLLTIKEDRAGNMWVGTENTGLVKIYLPKYNHELFYPNLDRSSSTDRVIRTIYEDTETGCLWIGTKEGSLYIYDKQMKLKDKLSFNLGAPYCITPDNQNNIWVGTKGNGIIIFPRGENPTHKGRVHMLSKENDSGINNIYTILQDDKDRMWVGTLGSGLFLCKYENGQLHTTPLPFLSEKQTEVRCLFQDSSGFIWAGGSKGIIRFNPDSVAQGVNVYQRFMFDHKNRQSLNNNTVKTIVEDAQNRIWIGTSGGVNLAQKDEVTDQIIFKHYTVDNGLISNMVQSLLVDDDNNLWIATENGISKFNAEHTGFENYSSQDSWENDMFSEASAYKKSNGELLFGSYNGMYIFDSSTSNKQDTPQITVTLTGLSINGVPTNPNKADSPLDESITKTKELKLNSTQNSFSIEFSSLEFQNESTNRYTYILEGYDHTWNPVTSYNTATYKNIPPGKYIFKVKAIDNLHSSDNAETELAVFITPPFWKSPQAFFLYFILLSLIVFFAIRLILKMNKLHNDVVVEKQLTEFRLRFFTNISHEFRTPLTIIQGSIENMNNMELPERLRKHIKILDKSSVKLLRLIDQLLEFRKLQKHQMDLRLRYIDVVAFMKDIFEMFQDTAAKNEIDFTFSTSKESAILLVDRGKIDKVLFNLLSNAFKHTPARGKIAVELIFDESDYQFIFKVSDSGIGIPVDKQEFLFVRFKQINYSSSGIGIGLNLSAELILAHKGEIKYEQSEWGGATFIVSLPTSESIYDKSDIIETSSVERRENRIEDSASTSESFDENSITRKYKILLIEDDEEVRSFLQDQLNEYFTVTIATNGLEGWNIATEEHFDLIVCDVMMPEMDGFEVTLKLKSNIETSHIPIILLTAHSSIEHRLEGINAGADSYITKPFSTKYLISRIVKLIEQREKLQYKFAHEPGEIPITISTSDRDNKFIAKVLEIVEKNLDNPEFSIDDFASEANMGRTLFYKKIKGITNLSPNEYLRVVRLKKAAILLRTTEFNISEIAYKVGFNDPYYFSKCFKEQFKERPSQFRQIDDENVEEEIV